MSDMHDEDCSAKPDVQEACCKVKARRIFGSSLTASAKADAPSATIMHPMVPASVNFRVQGR